LQNQRALVRLSIMSGIFCAVRARDPEMTTT
jgi:hypothetical protein